MLPVSTNMTLPVTLRRMTPRDMPLLAHWLTRDHVVEWWGGERPTLAMVSDIYLPRVEGKDGVTPYVALLAGRPFAYAQSYVAMGAGDGWWEDETDSGVRGIDQCIGEVELLNLGHGTRLVRALVAELFADPGVTKIQTDPSPANARAIRCYEKAGFRYARTVMTPDGPAHDMLVCREGARGSGS